MSGAIRDIGELENNISHFRSHWLEAQEGWLGPATGERLYQAFVYALQAAGSEQRGVTGVWVPATHDPGRVSVVEHANGLQVVLECPPPSALDNLEPHAPSPCGQVKKHAPDH